MDQIVKNPPAMQDTWVQSLGGEDPLEEGMTTYSSILAWRIPMDGGAWWAAVPGVAKSQTRLSDFPCGNNLPLVEEMLFQSLGQEDLLEKGMATYSSILAWRIPWTEEPDGLQFMGHKESDVTERLTLSDRKSVV